jgi:hypothetical protein
MIRMKTHGLKWLFSVGLVVACNAGESTLPKPDEHPQAPAPSGPETMAGPDGQPVPETPKTDPGTTTTTPTYPTRQVLNLVWERQQTGSWCGPSATRMVISTRETNLPSQQSLADELGTTDDGTAHVGLMVDLLNSRWKLTGPAAYVRHDIDDVPTQPQRDQLKKDVLERINAGYGIVANVISGWRPPGYPTWGVWHHYVSVVGYDDNGDKVLVADPAGEGGQDTAFTEVPRTYWIAMEDLGTWIGGRGYTGN